MSALEPIARFWRYPETGLRGLGAELPIAECAGHRLTSVKVEDIPLDPAWAEARAKYPHVLPAIEAALVADAVFDGWIFQGVLLTFPLHEDGLPIAWFHGNWPDHWLGFEDRSRPRDYCTSPPLEIENALRAELMPFARRLWRRQFNELAESDRLVKAARRAAQPTRRAQNYVAQAVAGALAKLGRPRGPNCGPALCSYRVNEAARTIFGFVKAGLVPDEWARSKIRERAASLDLSEPEIDQALTRAWSTAQARETP